MKPSVACNPKDGKRWCQIFTCDIHRISIYTSVKGKDATLFALRYLRYDPICAICDPICYYLLYCALLPHRPAGRLVT
jgi:hypothetical protein